MRKQNSISYQTSRLFLDAVRENEASASYCIVRGANHPLRIDLPPPITHRIFRLGQAYELRQLRYFESDAKFIIGQAETAEFKENLERLLALVNDDLLHRYVDEIVCALGDPSDSSQKTVTVSVGNYYD